MLKDNRGQQTIEYILLFTGVVVVTIFFVTAPNAAYKNKLNTTYLSGANVMATSTQQLFCSILEEDTGP